MITLEVSADNQINKKLMPKELCYKFNIKVILLKFHQYHPKSCSINEG